MSLIKFTATKLTGTGKLGVLKPDADGYYEQIIGGLNTFNSVGEYYTAEGATQLFEASSSFMRRTKSGCLKGELGHPKQLPGQSINEYLNRILTIEETNVVCHFKEIWLDTQFGKNNPKFNNPALVAVMAKFKPAGPKGDALRASLENPHEDVCFSIRALTRDYYQRGQTYRVLNQIVTFDNVNEPGLSLARKYESPAMEELIDCTIRRQALETIAKDRSFIATESSRALAIETLQSVQHHPKLSVSVLPTISHW